MPSLPSCFDNDPTFDHLDTRDNSDLMAFIFKATGSVDVQLHAAHAPPSYLLNIKYSTTELASLVDVPHCTSHASYKDIAFCGTLSIGRGLTRSKLPREIKHCSCAALKSNLGGLTLTASVTRPLRKALSRELCKAYA